MPNIKSAAKRARQNAARRMANRAKRSALRTAVKKVTASLAGKPEEARAALLAAIKKLDQAAAAGLIHKNTAARKKSRLTRKVNALAAKAGAE
ncbi:MAG: 30S ribosomal protein S20 [Firmicutes bacterium]|nr:30S ribosomal protein S20 [Bacillota bacterium]